METREMKMSERLRAERKRREAWNPFFNAFEVAVIALITAGAFALQVLLWMGKLPPH